MDVAGGTSCQLGNPLVVHVEEAEGASVEGEVNGAMDGRTEDELVEMGFGVRDGVQFRYLVLGGHGHYCCDSPDAQCGGIGGSFAEGK
jgi:hypothetical protein